MGILGLFCYDLAEKMSVKISLGASMNLTNQKAEVTRKRSITPSERGICSSRLSTSNEYCNLIKVEHFGRVVISGGAAVLCAMGTISS
jgi:hypothetical protein